MHHIINNSSSYIVTHFRPVHRPHPELRKRVGPRRQAGHPRLLHRKPRQPVGELFFVYTHTARSNWKIHIGLACRARYRTL